MPDNEFTAFDRSAEQMAASLRADLGRPWGVELVVDGRFGGVIGDVVPAFTAEETLGNLAALLRAAADAFEKLSEQEGR